MLAQRLHEQHGHIATQGKNGAPARGFSRPAEEWHNGGRQPHGGLIAQHADRLTGLEGPRHATYGLLVVHHLHAEAFARAAEEAIGERVPHAAGNGVKRNPARGDVRAAEFPVAEVPSYKDESASAR